MLLAAFGALLPLCGQPEVAGLVRLVPSDYSDAAIVGVLLSDDGESGTAEVISRPLFTDARHPVSVPLWWRFDGLKTIRAPWWCIMFSQHEADHAPPDQDRFCNECCIVQ